MAKIKLALCCDKLWNQYRRFCVFTRYLRSVLWWEFDQRYMSTMSTWNRDEGQHNLQRGQHPV